MLAAPELLVAEPATVERRFRDALLIWSVGRRNGERESM